MWRRKSEGGAGIPFPLAPFPSRPARALGWEAARLCVSREAKPAKIVSLIEKEFCARLLKEKEIFAGFVRRQAASRWGGFLPVRAEILAQKRFALRSVTATKREKESVEVEALRAPEFTLSEVEVPARSAEKPFLYSAQELPEKRRKETAKIIKKFYKFEFKNCPSERQSF